VLKFRDPVEKDFLGSFLRQHILTTMDRREVAFAQIRGNSTAPAGKPLPGIEGEEQWVLKDGDERLGEWQKATGLEHWTGMIKQWYLLLVVLIPACSHAPRDDT
jgi:hypothetical protein